MHGWFSQKQKDTGGKYIYDSDGKLKKTSKSAIYLDLDGNKVEVTMVTRDDKKHGANTRYLDDIRYVGKVEKWVKSIY